MQDHTTFDPKAYSILSVKDKFEYFNKSIHSIRDTLKPEKHLHAIGLPYLASIIEELMAYLHFFGPIVTETSPEMASQDIEALETSCESISSVYEALKKATNWLRVAHEVLATTENQKEKTRSFVTAFKFEYYECLDNSCEALSTAIQNIKIIDK